MGLVVLMLTNSGLPQWLACLRVEGHDIAELARPDHHLPLDPLHRGRREDGRGLKVVVEEAVGLDLLVPLQLPRTGEGQFRVGIEVGTGTAGPVGILLGTREGRGVSSAPVGCARPRVNGWRVPGSAAAVHLGIAPQVAILDGVERPFDAARLLIEGVDDAHRARRVEIGAADDRNRTQVERALIGGELLVDPLAGGLGNLPGPALRAVRGRPALRAAQRLAQPGVRLLVAGVRRNGEISIPPPIV